MTPFFAMVAVLAANAVGGAALPSAKAATARPPSHRAASDAPLRLVTSSATALGETRDARGTTRPIIVSNRNTNARADIRLYDDRGLLDRTAVRAFMEVADSTLDVRLVQLVVRASAHFGGAPVAIVSATRRGARGKHGSGEAIDFALEGVKAAALAAYLRGTPLAGVGIYTHPKTQYVHLDVRDRSFHWIDASPPGVTWREQRLPDPKGPARDAAYEPAMDLPER